ncbi:hypothetical protein H9L12_13020 [Sphingomonas rhizophila]|uniref:Uncharacterized protein n=1 Tax=Sphingomonas rhizophila TaxID=2071607 RepID=A0A7G9SB54_9SPHN|nr:hypothetical protein [Sphingomonas rhizophila]QNN65079.1 hypothetical protein H9L12_13020 [Sphingomonas rhizophila]
MGWRKIVAFALGALVVAVVAESHFGSTRYKLNGAAYSVPHQYEFARNFRLPWLESAEGLEKEPDESVWLLIPSHEMAREVPGYKRQFHGYSDDVEADVVVQILGGKRPAGSPLIGKKPSLGSNVKLRSKAVLKLRKPLDGSGYPTFLARTANSEQQACASA